MTGYRNLDDVKKSLVKDLNRVKFEKELWEKVEIVKKKDGSDFSVRSKSFKNAKWVIPSYSDSLHPELSVSGFNDANHTWEDFSLNMYIYTDTLPDEDERKSLGKSAWTYSRATYILTPDEAKSRIDSRILDLDLVIARLEKELEIADAVYCKFINAVADAIEELEKDTECVRFGSNCNHSSLEYRIIDVLDGAGTSKLSWKRSK